jgi:DNA repair protein RecN (Recombination protein N)
MLRFLRVSHLAIIDSVEVEFEPGFNVLTGETGAGKSILVEAVGLLLGDRASADLVRTGEEVASVEAIFEAGADELVVRREITAQGRSRAFVDGALVTAGHLKDLAARLIELHGQHEHQTLLDPSTHLAVLDTFAQLDGLVATCRDAHAEMRRVADELSSVRAALADRTAREDLVVFQLGELERAELTDPQEDTALAAERQVLASADRVERLCAESYASLYESEGAVLAELGQVWRRVGELAALDPRFQAYVEARDGIKAQLEDLAAFLRRYASEIDASPARLQQAEERLALLERLKRKYGPTLADVLARREALRRERADLEGGDDIVTLERAHAAARAAYLTAAGSLSEARRSAAVAFGPKLEAQVAELAMERTRFEVRLGPPLAEPAWTPDGFDAVEFFVSPNPGEALRPLARIVSGGELSRIMLAIKTLTFSARLTSAGGARVKGAGAPGLIFDEVDAGIGGRVADVVGHKLRALGSAFQVLAITHLPQIAAYADTHFQIDKRVERGRTVTAVRRLDAEGRVEEVARMLAGAATTDNVRAAAREMLRERAARAKGEDKGKGESESANAKPGDPGLPPQRTRRAQRT